MQQETIASGPTRYSIPQALIHDLRTPLNLIIGYSEMLTERAREAGPNEFVSDLEKVSLAGQRLLGIIAGNFDSTTQTSVAPLQANKVPLEESPRASSHVLPQVNEAPMNHIEGRLLVVDDDQGNRDVLTQRLKKQGYSVATAENGHQALEMLQAEAYDLVLLDIMMPEMDGYEVLRRLKANHELKNVPVIMVSALSELDSVVRCIELGAEDYLTKPFNAVLLKARLGACLEKKRGRDREMKLFDQLQQNYLRLQELEKLRDDLTNMIIHDLRTPLTSVIAAIQTLDVVGPVNEGQREIIEIAGSGSEALLNTINSLLDVDKFESGEMSVDYSLLSPTEIITSAIGQVASLANEKGITLVPEISPGLPWLNADENKLQRVLVNLLGNALKFTPPGGSVTLKVSGSDDNQAIRFCVQDTGEGIPPEEFGRIFEKFGQVDSRKGGRSMSTGLGLTFCKFAVEAHGGHIVVESVLGHGSSFSFTIPLSPPSLRGASAKGVD